MTAPESSLVAEVVESLAHLGFDIRKEVWCLLPTLDGGDQKRRIDVYARAPKEWEHYRRFPLLAIEAKRRTGGDMGGEIDGLYQTSSVMFAHQFRHDGADPPRPSISLYVDAESWGDYKSQHSRESMLVDRILWRTGCAVLRRDFHKVPFFTLGTTGQPTASFRFTE
jgi:hypothetical protein